VADSVGIITVGEGTMLDILLELLVKTKVV